MPTPSRSRVSYDGKHKMQLRRTDGSVEQDVYEVLRARIRGANVPYERRETHVGDVHEYLADNLLRDVEQPGSTPSAGLSQDHSARGAAPYAPFAFWRFSMSFVY